MAALTKMRGVEGKSLYLYKFLSCQNHASFLEKQILLEQKCSHLAFNEQSLAIRNLESELCSPTTYFLKRKEDLIVHTLTIKTQV